MAGVGDYAQEPGIELIISGCDKSHTKFHESVVNIANKCLVKLLYFMD